MDYNQTDCFDTNKKFWKFLGISIDQKSFRFYKLYSRFLVFFFVIVYNLLLTINLYYLPAQLDIVIEEILFFFMEMGIVSKVLTFILIPEKIAEVMNTLESAVFKPGNDKEVEIIDEAKIFIKKYWQIGTAFSVTSHFTHIFSPFIAHLLVKIPLELPVCSYFFLSTNTTQQFIYPLYLYQSIGMHFHMWYKVNIDTYFMGLLLLIVAQLEIIDIKLRRVTETKRNEDSDDVIFPPKDNSITELNKCITHYDEVAKFCHLVEDVFSVTLFIQFSMASCIICVCLFRFTLPAPMEYYLFLSTYIICMTVPIFVPCWFGTRVMEKSTLLSLAIYNSDWIPRSRQFKSNLRLLVERTNKPLSITAGKMFSLSLRTFTSIMNSAYSFFTVLRHMQSRQF